MTKSQDLDQLVQNLTGRENFREGFERVQKVLGPLAARLSSLSKIVIIAGTNGKGETSLSLTEKLGASGQRVCTWMSPHVVSLTERFRLGGVPIGEEELHKFLLKAKEAGYHQYLSYYEFLLAAFCLWAQESAPDVIVLEVGLGGRLDAVNTFEPDLCLLTSISRDHQEFLGNSLEKILMEKLGVCRSKIPLVSCLDSDFLRSRTSTFCHTKSIPWKDLWELCDDSMKNDYSSRNQFLAAVGASTLQGGQLPSLEEMIELRNHSGGTTFQSAPGRWEKVTLSGKNIIFVGAHNLDGHRALLKRLYSKEKVEVDILLGLSRRPIRDIRSIVLQYLSCERWVRSINICEFHHPRAMPAQEIFEAISENGSGRPDGRLALAGSWERTLELLDKKGDLLVTGSYYFIGEIKKHLTAAHSDLRPAPVRS